MNPEPDTKSALKLGNDAATEERRLRLRVLAKLMALCAIVAIVYVGFSSFTAETEVGAGVAALKVSLKDHEPGTMKSLVWESRPVLVYRRTADEIAMLKSASSDADGVKQRLRDPASKKSKQPNWAKSSYRSREVEWFVAIALGTDLGCSIDYLPASDSMFQTERWSGGFVDTCRKARYDLAGRVFKGQYANRNLVVPIYTIDGDVLVLGRP